MRGKVASFRVTWWLHSEYGEERRRWEISHHSSVLMFSRVVSTCNHCQMFADCTSSESATFRLCDSEILGTCWKKWFVLEETRSWFESYEMASVFWDKIEMLFESRYSYCIKASATHVCYSFQTWILLSTECGLRRQHTIIPKLQWTWRFSYGGPLNSKGTSILRRREYYSGCFSFRVVLARVDSLSHPRNIYSIHADRHKSMKWVLNVEGSSCIDYRDVSQTWVPM